MLGFIIFFNYLLRFEGPATGYWDTYITEPAFFIANRPVNIVSKDGDKLYSYSLPGKLPENLINNAADGISTKDQRLGGAIIFVPWYVFFNLFGFRLLFAMSGVLIAFFVFLTARLLSLRPGICFFAATISALNSYILSINTLNPNLLGMMLISIMLYLLIQKSPKGFVIGLVYGVLGGIRNESLLFLPAIIYKLFISTDNKGRSLVLLLLGTAITIAPILYWNYYAFGNPFMHPTQFPGLGGFRPVFEHHFLFWKFNFNGMLNYPFYHKLIRTPYFSFPTFLLLPLTLITSWGIIIFSFVFTGTLNLLKKHRATFIFLMLWFIPMYLLLSVQENWSELKMTFLLLIINPLVLFMSFGIEKLFSAQNKLRSLSQVIFLTASIFLLIRLVSFLDFTVDERWYVRFPRILEGKNISYIGDDLRTKKENPGELIAQKNNLTKGNLFPRLYYNKINISEKIGAIKQELVQKDITVVDFWRYIYEK